MRTAHSYDLGVTCDVTGQTKYPSASAVRRVMRKAGNRIRPYRCADCGGWHASSHNDLAGDFNRPRRGKARNLRRAR